MPLHSSSLFFGQVLSSEDAWPMVPFFSLGSMQLHATTKDKCDFSAMQMTFVIFLNASKPEMEAPFGLFFKLCQLPSSILLSFIIGTVMFNEIQLVGNRQACHTNNQHSLQPVCKTLLVEIGGAILILLKSFETIDAFLIQFSLFHPVKNLSECCHFKVCKPFVGVD